MAGNIQLNVTAAEIDSTVLDHKNSTIASTRVFVNTTGFTDATLTNSQLVAQAVDTNQTNLNSIRDQYELLQYYQNIAAGTTGTVAIPTGYTIELDRFAQAIDAIIVKQGTDTRPTDEIVITSSGNTVSTTLDGDGNYVLSGTPSAYPVCIVYFLKGKRKDRGNINFSYLMDTTEYFVVPVEIRTLTSSITFTNESNYEETVVADTLAKSTDNVIVEPTSLMEDCALQGFKAGLLSINQGVGYTIYGANTNGMTGTYSVKLLIN